MSSRLASFLILLVAMLIPAHSAWGQSSATIKKQKAEKTRQLQEAGNLVNRNARETERRLNSLQQLQAEMERCDANITLLTARVDSLQAASEALSDTIAAIDSTLTRLSTRYADALRRLHLRRSSTSDISFLFSSDSFSQAYRRYRALRQFAKWRARRADEISALKATLDARRSDLQRMKNVQATALAQVDAERATIAVKQQQTDKLVAELRSEARQLRATLERRRREVEDLDRQLQKVIAEEQERIERERIAAEKAAAEKAAREKAAREKAAAEKAAAEKAAAAKAEAEKAAREKAEAEKATAGKPDKDKKSDKKVDKKKQDEQQRIEQARRRQEELRREQQELREKQQKEQQKAAPLPSSAQLTQQFVSRRGSLPAPVGGRITLLRPFGRQRHPSLPMVETNNSGVDLLVPEGSKALAVHDGEVSAIFRQPGYNTIVMIRHGDYLTIYANLDHVSVKKGDRVSPGTVIGIIQPDDEDDSRSVLHFEIRREREKENPQLWIRGI
ncbi:MAG: peptidoglycan DD-metalloendopeptidase family protein [Muribaculaceae bacterium]|nr:peptidoglycan DD-metalloendopeptidase family protein [Muribaculaceae bacterium]